MTITSNLPIDLREKGYFCCWRYEAATPPREDGKPTKIPYNPKTGGRAQSNNPSTFTTLEEAEAVQGRYDGLGVGVFGDLGAIDIDHCIDEGGSKTPMAEDIVSIAKTAGAYVELSPSGAGIRILFWIPTFQYDKKKFYINNQKLGLEVYVSRCTQKYLTVTGNVLHGCAQMPDFSAGLQQVLDKYMVRSAQLTVRQPSPQASLPYSDSEIVRKIERSVQGNLFTALMSGDTTGYASYSEADLALLNILAWWTGRNPVQMDRIYQKSGLMRDKWERRQNGTTWGAEQIEKACKECSSVYNPKEYQIKKYVAARPDAHALPTAEPSKIETALKRIEPDKNSAWYSRSDQGSGRLFADVFKDIARYVPERKKWYIYNGIRWVPDTGNMQTMELCKSLGDALIKYAIDINEESVSTEYTKYALEWRKRNRRETFINDAASVYPVRIHKFDVDPYVFNCLNGTLQLDTGEFKEHSPDDMLSKVSGVLYDPNAKSERWERFIKEVMGDDTDKAAYLQKAMGYTLTGDTRHECFFVLYGPKTRNGKGTTMETFMNMMGDYGTSTKPDTIAQKQTANGSGPSEDIARLAGARFVNISEPDQRLVLSTALVKTLTGNDTITARFLHENSFEYRPQFKLFINTNHLPKVTDVTLFSSGRVKLIPFERHFTPEEQDGNLKTELSIPENLSGILNWCIAGLRAIEEEGFQAPKSVAQATDAYRADSDKLGRFLADEMIEDPNGETRTMEAYQRYMKWCDDNGFKSENIGNFKKMMENVADVCSRRPAGANRNASPVSLIAGYRLSYHEFTTTTAQATWSHLKQRAGF